LRIATGTRLGHYEIIEFIGAGGMGEVYKALDPRLNRTVAVKILLEHISDSPEARARFKREAQTIASLNNPHICVVYDVGSHQKTDFLVMELLEGETLARRLERGPLPLDQALRYAAEISDALDRAHQEITHRDLKPGNIMITRSGLKLLDFGLAKLRQSQNATILSGAPTKMDATAEGTILGTIQYMAPEQLEGAETDARTDIFAFGAVLHEMLTGRKAFSGKSAVSVMSSILKDNPQPVSQLQPASPPAIDRLIARCLAKHPDDRWQSAGDLSYELKWLAGSGLQPAGESYSKPASSTKGWRRPTPLSVVALIALTAGAGLAAWILKPVVPSVSALTARVAVPLPPGDILSNTRISPIALSSDGKLLAYVAFQGTDSPQLYLRPIDSLEAKPIAGTRGASAPFFSPSGKWIGFFAQGKLKKVPISGGAPDVLCDTGYAMGGTWGTDDTIYYSPNGTSGIWKIPAGGECQEVTSVDRNKGEVSHRTPQILPGGKALVFTVWTGPGSDEKHLDIQILGTAGHRELLHGASSGHYVASGHVLYSRSGALMAAAFDLAGLQMNGSSVPLAEWVLDSEAASFAVSDSGALAYLPLSSRRNERRLVWVNPNGSVTPLPGTPKPYFEPTISPHGDYVAVTIDGPAESISILDLMRNSLTSFTPTSVGSSQAPVWTRDGKRLAYRGTRKGFRNVFWKAVDGSGDEERLTIGENNQAPGSFSLNDEDLVYTDLDSVTSTDIWKLPLSGDRKPTKVRVSSPMENSPRVSPNNNWLAYTSYESGKAEVYVVPFPGLGRNYPVSTDGGTEPVWSRDGNKLFYRNGDKMMAVDVTTQPDFKAGTPRILFEGQYEGSDTGRAGYDVASDGRFLMIQPLEPEQPRTKINLVIHWFEELKRLAPAGKPD
jgi:serine/threonine protein kinase